MNYKLTTIRNQSFIECLPDGELIQNEPAILELIAGCGEYGTDLLMIHAENLPADFYDLKTGLAGTILQKLTNYWIRSAIIVSRAFVGKGHFYEMILETNRGRQFNFCYDRETAEKWLIENNRK